MGWRTGHRHWQNANKTFAWLHATVLSNLKQGWARPTRAWCSRSRPFPGSRHHVLLITDEQLAQVVSVMSSAQANSKLKRVHKWMNAQVATGLNAHILRLHGKKKKEKNITQLLWSLTGNETCGQPVDCRTKHRKTTCVPTSSCICTRSSNILLISAGHLHANHTNYQPVSGMWASAHTELYHASFAQPSNRSSCLDHVSPRRPSVRI